MLAKSVALFIAAAFAEIGGACLVWTAVKDGRGLLVGARSVRSPRLLRRLRGHQPDNEFGRVLAAYGGVFIVGSLAWGIAFDGFRPDRYDIIGAAICLVGTATIMYWPL